MVANLNNIVSIVGDISGITDPAILNITSGVICIGLVLVTLNFAVGIISYIFKPNK